MNILGSQVNKPENVVSKAIKNASTETAQAIKELETVLSGYKPGLSDLAATLLEVDKAVKRIEQTDNSVDPLTISAPITEQLNRLRDLVQQHIKTVQDIEVNPDVHVTIEPPDLTKIQEAFTETTKDINELFKELDLMERPEMKEYFKKILDLLDKINKKTWSFIGGGGGSNILQGYEINSGNLVNITAVESADTPGVYGVLALNADGSAIGSGGGVVETFKRITENGDIRITSSGDTRVYVT